MSSSRTRLKTVLALGVIVAVTVGVLVFSPAMRERWHLSRLDSTDPSIQADAIQALGALGSVSAAPDIERVARGAPAELLHAALDALWRLGPEGRARIPAALEGRAWPERERALERLESVQTSAALLLEVIASELEARDGPALDWAAAHPHLVPELRKQLADATRRPVVRRGAAIVIARMAARRVAGIDRPRDALPDLLRVARDPDAPPDLRGAAFDAVDVIGGRQPGGVRGRLDIADARAGAGEEVLLELSGGFERPISNFIVFLEIPPSVVEFIGAEVSGCELENWPSAGLVSNVANGEVQTGYLLSSVEHARLIEPDVSRPLVKLRLRVRDTATPGRHPISIKRGNATAVGGRSALTNSGRVAWLEVLPGRAGSAAKETKQESNPTPKPATVASLPALTCAAAANGVELTWDAARLVDAASHVDVLRDGERLARVETAAGRFVDAYEATLLTRYELRAGSTVLAKALINAFEPPFHFRAELRRAKTGERDVRVRIFATNAEASQGFSFGLRVRPELARLAGVVDDGTVTERSELGSFLVQKHALARGETAVGALDMSPPISELAAGVEQHVATVLIDIPDDVESGAVIPVEFGPYGEPPGDLVFTVGGRSRETTATNGAILVGASPVPPPENFRAARVVVALDSGTAAHDIRLSWTSGAGKNDPPYYLLALERNGTPIATLPGDATGFTDRAAGPGAHRYRLTAIARGDEVRRSSFPVETGLTD